MSGVSGAGVGGRLERGPLPSRYLIVRSSSSVTGSARVLKLGVDMVGFGGSWENGRWK